MIDVTWSEPEEIKSLKMRRPHLVILGAGASLAAFPSGDRNGRRLPLMKTFADVVGLTNILKAGGVLEPYDDFEAIYSDIAIDKSRHKLKAEIEKRVVSYFSSLELPDVPTLYDHLVLSLRPKDVIATFNWDPFLCQAASRNYSFGGAPRLLFLHGNVAYSYCASCGICYIQKGVFRCKCGKSLMTPPLLYPVKQKNYQIDPAIARNWRALEQVLKDAWGLTIFGYGAPQTDIEAVRIMSAAWGDVCKRELEETEMIDVRTEDDLITTWAPFVHTHHYTIHRSFYDSCIARFPRRSGEALWEQLMECKFLSPHRFPRDASFHELYDWLKPRVDAEQEG